MKLIQELVDEQLKKLLADAQEQGTPVDEFLASLREHAETTGFYWVLVERTYQLAADQSIFLNSNSFLKLRRKQVLRTEGITPTSAQEVPGEKPRVAVGENVALLPGTVGRILDKMKMTKSLRALVYELFSQDAEHADPAFVEKTQQAGLTDFEQVFKLELSEQWGDHDYIDFES